MNRYGNLKTVKEIAAEVGRSRFYVHAAKAAMERDGITWPLNMLPTEDFVKWVVAHQFRCTGYGAKRTGGPVSVGKRPAVKAGRTGRRGA